MSDLPRVTRSAEKLIVLLYKHYLSSLRNGAPREQARFFGDYDTIASRFCPDESEEDVTDLLWELSRANYIEMSSYDSMPSECALTTECVAMMENRFADGIKGILDFLSKFT